MWKADGRQHSVRFQYPHAFLLRLLWAPYNRRALPSSFAASPFAAYEMHGLYAQVIDILMTADLSGDARMGQDGMAGPAGPGPTGWGQNMSPHTHQHQGPPYHQVTFVLSATN